MKQCEKCSRKFPDHMVFCPFDGDILDAEVEDPLIGRVLDGKYRLEEKLGEGGMGTVYKAKHVLIQNDLAIKVLHSSLVADRHAVARFQREATAAARIKHPNAVGVTDFGRTDDEIVYIVMELFIGLSLRDIIEQYGPLDIARAVTIIRQVCLALDAAHRSGVIHRDVKPDNIVIEQNGQGELVKVLDFGIAKLKDGPNGDTGGRLTRQGVIIGSPHYLSPEQCQNSELDARSDIYSLGIVLYEMFTGDVPFKAPTPIAVAMMHTTEKPAPVSEKRPEIPEQLERVVMRALEKLAANRPQSALELAQELERACLEAGVPVMPLPGSTAPYTLAENNATYQTRQLTGAHAAAAKSGGNIPVLTKDEVNNNGNNNGNISGEMIPDLATTVSLTPEASQQSQAQSQAQAQPSPSSSSVHPFVSGQYSAETPSFISNIPSNPPPTVPQAVSLGNTSAIFNVAQYGVQTESNNRIRLYGAIVSVLVITIAVALIYGFSGSEPQPAVAPNKPADPAALAPEGMIYVKGDAFKMGSNKGDKIDGPEHEVRVEAFYIDKNEVTNEQYKKFIDAAKYAAPKEWKDGQFPPGTDLKPVTNVSWADAAAYAKWANKRLPTEKEWEYAARGTDGRSYPWGEQWIEGAAVSKELDATGTYNAGSLSKGASPFGILDMAGNVWEWTADNFTPYPGNKDSIDAKLKGNKVIRGGSFKSDKKLLTSYLRNVVEPDLRDSALGFRCAKSVQ